MTFSFSPTLPPGAPQRKPCSQHGFESFFIPHLQLGIGDSKGQTDMVLQNQ